MPIRSRRRSTRRSRPGSSPASSAHPGRFSFSHALVRETLYAEIPATRRAAVHSRIAAALEELHGDETVAQLADARPPVHRGRAARATRPARSTTRRRAGPAGDRAARPRGRGRRCSSGPSTCSSSAATTTERSLLEIDLELGEAEIRASRYPEAREVLERAAALARELGDDERFARAACDISALSARPARSTAASSSWSRKRSIGAGAEEGKLRSQLLSALSAEYYWEDPVGKAEPLSVEALELARKIGDDEAIAQRPGPPPVRRRKRRRRRSPAPRREPTSCSSSGGG